MFLKLLMVSVIIVAFTILALGVKLLFNRVVILTEHACSMEDGELNDNGDCSGCEIKELANCTEKHN